MGVEHQVVTLGRRAPHRRRARSPRIPRRPAPLRRGARGTRLGRRPTTTALLRRQLDVLHDGFVPHQVPADLRRAIVELETRVESTFNNFRGQIDGQRVDDNAIAEILRTSDDTDEPPRRMGGVEADRPRGRRPASASSPGSATRRHRRSAPVTTSRWRWPRASSTRIACSPRSTTSTAPPRHRSREWKHDGRRAARGPVRCRGRRAAPVALRRPVLPGPRRPRARSPSTTSSPTPTSRRSPSAPTTASASTCAPVLDAQRPVRARRQEPARVLHRHRPRRRRAGALQRGAQRAVDGHDAPRVRARDLRP